MEKTNYKKQKTILIIFNIFLSLLLLLSSAITISLAIEKYNMNVGGNMTFKATDVQASISAGQVANGTVTNGENKMLAINITPENDGATQKATWENLDITFDGIENVIISFSVTNNHTESNLKLTLSTSYEQINNMTMSTEIDDINKTSVIIPKQAEGNDNTVDCEIIFQVESNLQSGSIQGFSVNYTFENTDEEPAAKYSISLDSTATDIVSSLSTNLTEENATVTFTATAENTVSATEIIMQEIKIKDLNGEEILYTEENGQYSFTMPASNVTISTESQSYRRLDDFEFNLDSIIYYVGSDSEVILPSYYETVNINSQDYIIEKNSGTQITKIEETSFMSNENITSITIPASVTEIGLQAFYGCTNLQSVNFEANSKLQLISPQAFYGCTSLLSIIIPASVLCIDDEAFRGCTKLRALGFETNPRLEVIGSAAFYGCFIPGLFVIIPPSVSVIGTDAFKGAQIRVLFNGTSIDITTDQYGSASDIGETITVYQITLIDPNTIEIVDDTGRVHTVEVPMI